MLCSCISMGSNLTRSTFVYSNYLYVNDRSKCSSSILFQVMQCNVAQGHAKSCNVMQCMQGKQAGESHTYSVSFTLLSRHFACTQAFSGSWREVVIYHRWSLEFRLVFLCCFFRNYLYSQNTSKIQFPPTSVLLN